MFPTESMERLISAIESIEEDFLLSLLLDGAFILFVVGFVSITAGFLAMILQNILAFVMGLPRRVVPSKGYVWKVFKRLYQVAFFPFRAVCVIFVAGLQGVRFFFVSTFLLLGKALISLIRYACGVVGNTLKSIFFWLGFLNGAPAAPELNRQIAPAATTRPNSTTKTNTSTSARQMTTSASAVPAQQMHGHDQPCFLPTSNIRKYHTRKRRSRFGSSLHLARQASASSRLSNEDPICFRMFITKAATEIVPIKPQKTADQLPALQEIRQCLIPGEVYENKVLTTDETKETMVIVTLGTTDFGTTDFDPLVAVEYLATRALDSLHVEYTLSTDEYAFVSMQFYVWKHSVVCYEMANEDGLEDESIGPVMLFNNLSTGM